MATQQQLALSQNDCKRDQISTLTVVIHDSWHTNTQALQHLLSTPGILKMEIFFNWVQQKCTKQCTKKWNGNLWYWLLFNWRWSQLQVSQGQDCYSPGTLSACTLKVNCCLKTFAKRPSSVFPRFSGKICLFRDKIQIAVTFRMSRWHAHDKALTIALCHT